MLGIVLALTSAVAYGMSDFVGGLAARRAQALRVVLVSYPISALVIAVAALFVDGAATAESLIWGVASGLVMALAMWWFYLALAQGPMSVVSPLTAVIVAVLPVVVGIVMGERPHPVAYLGIVLAMAAVLLVTKEGSATDRRTPAVSFTPRVRWLTLGAGSCFALCFVFTHQIAAGTGLWPLFVARGTASVVILAAALVTRQGALPARPIIRLAIVIGLLDVAANVTMFYAFHNGLLSIVSVLIALYPAVTVGLAIAVLKERVIHVQVTGLLLALVAITTVAVSG